MSTIGDGVLAMLGSGPKTISELYEGVAGKRASIDKACLRLVKKGEIERVDRGLYAKKVVLGGRALEEISWKKLSEDEKDNYRLNMIAFVIEDCCELMDKAAYNQDADIVEKLQSLVVLFQNCAHFSEAVQREFLSLKAEWLADPPADTDVERLFNGEASKTRPLKLLVELLFQLMAEK